MSVSRILVDTNILGYVPDGEESAHNIPLFTADMELFKIKEIQIIEFYPERS